MENISIITTNQGTKQELAESLTLAAEAGIKPIVEVSRKCATAELAKCFA